MKKKLNGKRGFTMAELLVVVAIIGVLVAIAMPTFKAQLEKAQAATEEANVRAMYAEAVANYLDNDGKLTKTDYTAGNIGGTASISGDNIKLEATASTLTYYSSLSCENGKLTKGAKKTS